MWIIGIIKLFMEATFIEMVVDIIIIVLVVVFGQVLTELNPRGD